MLVTYDSLYKYGRKHLASALNRNPSSLKFSLKLPYNPNPTNSQNCLSYLVELASVNVQPALVVVVVGGSFHAEGHVEWAFLQGPCFVVLPQHLDGELQVAGASKFRAGGPPLAEDQKQTWPCQQSFLSAHLLNSNDYTDELFLYLLKHFKYHAVLMQRRRFSGGTRATFLVKTH